MNVFELTRALVDIESITANEERVGEFLLEYLAPLVSRHGGSLERLPVEPRRFNVFAQWGAPLAVTLSTHLDTVPPFIGSREDGEHIWGRGACDAKGIAASMIGAAEALLEEGRRGFGLLFVVGEERNSAGARRAAETPRGSHYIINGEPTGNKLALASKGPCATKSWPPARWRIRRIPSWRFGHTQADRRAGPHAEPEIAGRSAAGASTLNIGTISGGRAPNVMADEARAEILIRLVGDSASTKEALARAAEGLAELREVLEIPALHLNAIAGLETSTVAFTTDIPMFEGQWARRSCWGGVHTRGAHARGARAQIGIARSGSNL